MRSWCRRTRIATACAFGLAGALLQSSCSIPERGNAPATGGRASGGRTGTQTPLTTGGTSGGFVGGAGQAGGGGLAVGRGGDSGAAGEGGLAESAGAAGDLQVAGSPGAAGSEPTMAYCGNGQVDEDEICDDGNTLSGDGYSGDCRSAEICGNGVVDVAAGEVCDDGNLVDGDGCKSGCMLPTCGDGSLDPGETCDDGNLVDGDGCNATCTSDESCGNRIVDTAAGEECDDGNRVLGDGCTSGCQIEYCGNDHLDPRETCDDGNTLDGDGCSGDCRSDETCGNSIVDTAVGEQCDDGNTLLGDGCSGACQIEYCGNDNLDPGEICDDGNNASGDGCSGDCASEEVCGNGYLDFQAGEACDDGNSVAGDGCSPHCILEGLCGNGATELNEACDDGNNLDGDGCSADCWSDEMCGNGVVDVNAAFPEICDDSNVDDYDGCSATCQIDLVNGSFESGDMVGWTFAPIGPEIWTVLSSGQPLPPLAPDYSEGGADEPTDPLFGIGLPATEGEQLAYYASNYSMSGPVPAVRMYQDVMLPPTPVDLGWDMAWQSTAGFVTGQQSIRVLLRDASTDGLLAVLWDSAEGAFRFRWRLSSFASPLAAFAGLEVRIEIEIVATLGPLDVQLDDFRLV